MHRPTLALMACCWISILAAADSKVRTVDVRILSTMLADDDGFGEWGFAALVTVDGRPILFDTGAHPDTVLRNAKLLKVDLSSACGERDLHSARAEGWLYRQSDGEL
jgi:7,8-dihydropterin-6-yl-methyl-4-(beta-D-ribofuranosyl)aminobenzene 5'-phosphate synthase